MTTKVPNRMLGNVSYSGFRNRIINGDMRIDQANNGASVTVNSAALFYGADMFSGEGTASAGVFSMQQVSATPPTGFKNYTRLTTTTADAAPAAGALYIFRHIIEGLNLVDFALGTASAVQITLSFWVRSSLTGSFSGSLANGASNRSYPFSFTINSANTWEQKTVTLTGDITGTWATDNTAGLALYIDLGNGSTFRSTAATWQAGNFLGVTSAVRLISTLSATLDITGVQIEPGSDATTFEYVAHQTILSRCKRYYEVGGTLDGMGTGNGYLGGTFMFEVEKRSTPTFTHNTAVGAGFTGLTVDTVTRWSVRIFATGNGGSGVPCNWQITTWAADSRL